MSVSAHAGAGRHMLDFMGGCSEIMDATAPVYCLVFEVISVNTKDLFTTSLMQRPI